MDNFLEDEYFTFDRPVPYKNLLIYPVKIKDYNKLLRYATCFLLDKNSVPDIKIISMSYLEYLFYLHQQGEPYLYFFSLLLQFVCKVEENDVVFGVNNKGKPYFSVKGTEYGDADFEKIRDIICQQNMIQLIDETIQKEIRDKMEKAMEYKRKFENEKPGTIEDKIICILISTPLKLDDIYDLTVRKFDKILERIDYKLHYKIYLQAQMSGMVEFKDKNQLKHWMSDLRKNDSFSDVKVDMNEMQAKINNINQ